MSVTIRHITTQDTLQLRRDVMYPEWSLDQVTLPHDAGALHFGLYDGSRQVTVASLFIDGASAQFRKLATATDQQGKGFGKRFQRFQRFQKEVSGLEANPNPGFSYP